MKRISALDGIRGLAILLVICWHYLTMEIRAPLPSPYTLAGFFYGLSCSTWCGVDLFFVLSGYLIGGILLDNRDSENFLRVFYRRRICRIFPLYFGWLAICVIICKTALIKVHVLAQIFYPETQFTYYFFYLQNLAGQMAAGKMPVSLAVTWSLAVEEQFYMVMPAVVLLLPRKWLAALMGAVFILTPFIRMHSGPLASLISTFCRWDGLALGVLIALAERTASAWDMLINAKNLVRVLWVVCFVSGWVAPMYGIQFGPFLGSVLVVNWAALLVLAVSANGYCARLLSGSFLVKSGLISYGLYLFHFPMLYFVFWWQHDMGLLDFYDWVQTALAFFLTWLVATISYRWLESPIIAAGHRLKYLSKL